MSGRIRVIQPEKPIPTEVLAESIVKISKAAESLRVTGLNEEAIIILLSAKTGIGKSDCRAVLNGLRQLEGWYCR